MLKIALEEQHLRYNRKKAEEIMKKYKQLNYEERVSIRYGLFKGASIREISRMLERNPHKRI